MSIDYQPSSASLEDTRAVADTGARYDTTSIPFPNNGHNGARLKSLDMESEAPAENSEAITFDTSDLSDVLGNLLNNDSRQIYAECLQFMERYVLTEILRRTNGNQSEAARLLGITRGSLRYKIRAAGLTVQRIVQCTDGVCSSNE